MPQPPRTSLSLRPPLPVRLLRDAAARAQEWPVAGEAVRRLRLAEAWAVAELKQRMEELADARLREPPPASADDCRHQLAQLLASADNRSLDEACCQQYGAVLAQLCPDQAKMLAVLAPAGRRVPLVHVGAATLPGGAIRHMVLENATALGREAGVTLREHVPRLVGHLRALGLLALGPEDSDAKAAYEMLGADTNVRAALVQVKNELNLWPRVQRHTVALSPFGQELWQAVGP